MQKNRLVIGISAGVLIAFGIFGAGCKKEEPKVETTAPAPVAPQAAAPQPVAAGMFSAQITVDNPPQNMKAGATVSVPVKIKNSSSEKWAKDPANPINLSYHWKKEGEKKPTVWDGTRTPITKDVAPGEEISLNPKVKTPKAGKYVLEFDMVADAPNGGWFAKKGSQVASVPVEVK